MAAVQDAEWCAAYGVCMVRIDLHKDAKREEGDERCDDKLLAAARREEGGQPNNGHLECWRFNARIVYSSGLCRQWW